MGGYAPYYSTAGMFISSMKIRVFRVPFAPLLFLRFFSNLLSMLFYVEALSVWALKLRLIEMNSIASQFALMKSWTIMDFPVPVSPVIKTGLLIFVSIFKWFEYLSVSTVGTTSEKNGVGTYGYSKVGTTSFQWKNYSFFSSK